MAAKSCLPLAFPLPQTHRHAQPGTEGKGMLLALVTLTRSFVCQSSLLAISTALLPKQRIFCFKAEYGNDSNLLPSFFPLPFKLVENISIFCFLQKFYMNRNDTYIYNLWELINPWNEHCKGQRYPIRTLVWNALGFFCLKSSLFSLMRSPFWAIFSSQWCWEH